MDLHHAQIVGSEFADQTVHQNIRGCGRKQPGDGDAIFHQNIRDSDTASGSETKQSQYTVWACQAESYGHDIFFCCHTPRSQAKMASASTVN